MLMDKHLTSLKTMNIMTKHPGFLNKILTRMNTAESKGKIPISVYYELLEEEKSKIDDPITRYWFEMAFNIGHLSDKCRLGTKDESVNNRTFSFNNNVFETLSILLNIDSVKITSAGFRDYSSRLSNHNKRLYEFAMAGQSEEFENENAVFKGCINEIIEKMDGNIEAINNSLNQMIEDFEGKDNNLDKIKLQTEIRELFDKYLSPCYTFLSTKNPEKDILSIFNRLKRISNDIYPVLIDRDKAENFRVDITSTVIHLKTKGKKMSELYLKAHNIVSKSPSDILLSDKSHKLFSKTKDIVDGELGQDNMVKRYIFSPIANNPEIQWLFKTYGTIKQRSKNKDDDINLPESLDINLLSDMMESKKIEQLQKEGLDLFNSLGDEDDEPEKAPKSGNRHCVGDKVSYHSNSQQNEIREEIKNEKLDIFVDEVDMELIVNKDLIEVLLEQIKERIPDADFFDTFYVLDAIEQREGYKMVNTFENKRITCSGNEYSYTVRKLTENTKEEIECLA